jgi:hypothetical protein
VSAWLLYNSVMYLSVWTRLFIVLAAVYIAFLVVLSRSRGLKFWKNFLLGAVFLIAPWRYRKIKPKVD